MLRLDMEPGESVRIGDFCTITLEDKSGKKARISFDADKSVPIRKVMRQSAVQGLKDGLGVAALPA